MPPSFIEGAGSTRVQGVAGNTSQSRARIRRWQIGEIIGFLSRYGLAAVWLVAGFEKIKQGTVHTAQSVEAYEIFGKEFSLAIAQVIGPLEIAGAFLLIAGIFLRKSGWLSAVVLVLFIIGISQAWVRGLTIDCGCFGEKATPDGAGMDYLRTILRDVVLIFMSIWTAYRPYRRFALYP